MRLRCVGWRDETADVRTWTFADEAGGPFAFAAGQALTLTLPVPSGPVPRTFSIASSARRPGRVELTVKRNPAGLATPWMRDALLPGMVIEARGPHGAFILPEGAGKLLLISAGSGATPLMSMLRTLADAGEVADVGWVHAARRPADLLFAGELAALQRAMPALAVSFVVSQPDPGWFGYRGRVGRRLLSVIAPDLAERHVLCCGPAGFMDEVRRVHAAEGGEPARFQVEHFAPALPPAESQIALAPGEGFTVAVAGHAFQALASETVLQAAARQNVVIPCGCGGGMCGTCRLRLREGTVDMRHAGGLSREEEAAGWILACSSRPRSDLVLEA